MPVFRCSRFTAENILLRACKATWIEEMIDACSVAVEAHGKILGA
jgi:hypothetical protein